jgi:hypothetical protein
LVEVQDVAAKHVTATIATTGAQRRNFEITLIMLLLLKEIVKTSVTFVLSYLKFS